MGITLDIVGPGGPFNGRDVILAEGAVLRVATARSVPNRQLRDEGFTKSEKWNE